MINKTKVFLVLGLVFLTLVLFYVVLPVLISSKSNELVLLGIAFIVGYIFSVVGALVTLINKDLTSKPKKSKV